jgi:hypothetical protein
MTLHNEKAFLEEVARRLNSFFEGFPDEAHAIFGESKFFGQEVEEMFRAFTGQNKSIPFGILFATMMAPLEGDVVYHLVMAEDEAGQIAGFQVIDINDVDAEQAIAATRKFFGFPSSEELN